MPVVKPARGARLNPAHPLARGLVGCWLFNEGTGDRVYDVSGNENTGTLTNMTESDWIGGRDGGVLDFDGSDDVITGVSRLGGATEFTITVLVNHKAAGGSLYGAWISSNTDFNGGYFFGRNDDDNAQIYVSTKQVETPINILNEGTYRAWTAVYKGSEFIKIYVDGEMVVEDTTTIPASVPAHTGYEIGQNLNGPYQAACYIGCVYVHNLALMDAEVFALHESLYQMFEQATPAGIFSIGAVTHQGVAAIDSVSTVTTVGVMTYSGVASILSTITHVADGKLIYAGAAVIESVTSVIGKGLMTYVGEAVISIASVVSAVASIPGRWIETQASKGDWTETQASNADWVETQASKGDWSEA
jgi:hypothetical protein